MKWIKNNLTLSVVLTLALALVAVGAAFVRVQVHAEDAMVHVDGQNYVPRNELEKVEENIDRRLDKQDVKLEDIHDDLNELQQWLLDNR